MPRHGRPSTPASTTPPPTVTGVTPTSGATSVLLSSPIKVTFDQAMDAASINVGTFVVRDAGSNLVSGTVGYNATTREATFSAAANLDASELHTITIDGGTGGVRNLGGIVMVADYVSTFTTEAAPPPPTGLVPVGYAATAGVTGGGTSGGTVYNIDCDAAGAWTQFQNACEATGQRRVFLHGSKHLNGNDAQVSVDNGDLTIDGTDYTGVIYNAHNLLFKPGCNNVIMTQLAIRTMEGATEGQSNDRRNFTINGGNSGTGPAARCEKFLIDHCSFAWAPDVVGSILSDVRNVTIQYCIMGPGLYLTNTNSSPNGYGMNTTVPGNSFPDTYYARNLTFYRNLYARTWQRNLKFEHPINAEAVNNVVYEWIDECCHGNPRGCSFVANMLKKGPNTKASTLVFDPDTNYPQYPASTYFPLVNGGGPSADANLGFLPDMTPFTPTVSIQASSRITSRYATLQVTPQPASPALLTAVVNAAGRTYQDEVDIELKQQVLSGTSDPSQNDAAGAGGKTWGLYNGAGHPGPHPYLPSDTPPPPVASQLGYAGLYNSGAGVTGGAGATGSAVMNVTTYAELKAALESSVTPRIVKVTGSNLIDGNGDTLSVFTGGVTLDGIQHTRSMKGFDLIFRASNVIVRNCRLRPGDAPALGDSAAAIKFNPPVGATISGFLIEHCHLAWAEDVCFNVFNKVTDGTVQYCMIGPALYQTPNKTGQNGYGCSTHGDEPNRHHRISFIRNFLVHNYQRNMRPYGVENVEFINNAIYNWGTKCCNTNPVGANFVSNMAKRGLGTQASNEYIEMQLYGADTAYWPNSIYWNDNLMWSRTNAPITLVANDTIFHGTGNPRATPYNGGLHGYTALPASLSLMNQIVAESGTPTPDSLEIACKADYTNGTWPGDWYNAIPGSPVMPAWP